MVDKENGKTSLTSKNNGYKDLIANHPCFFLLNNSEIDELARLAFEKHYATNEIILRQGEDIEALYFILKGDVEVAINQKKTDKVELVPESILKKGDSIGLSNTGFFAKEGVRTATLTALSEVILIGWPINTFLDFLQTHPHISNSMQQSAKLVEKSNFIKKLASFSKLTTQEIVHISRDIEEIFIPSDTIIFHEGEIGDQCYLIESGKVEITITDKNGSPRTIAILTPSMFFGEIALLSNAPRNATAKMLEGGRLLMFHKEQLKKLITSHSHVAESFISFAMVHSRPVHAPNVKHFRRSTVEGEKIIILKNTKLRRYYQLSAIGWFIWQKLDGTQNIEDITIALFREFKIFSPETVSDIIFSLEEAGFLIFPKLPEIFLPASTPQKNPTWFDSIKLTAKKLFFIRFIFDDIDKNISASYRNGVHLLFTPLGQRIIEFITTIGFFLFILSAEQAIFLLPSVKHFFLIVISLFITYYLSVIFHELGHAYTVKSFGHEVHRAGVIFYWVGLFAFVDTSDMWLSKKRKRILVNLAGVRVDLLMAGLASLGAFLTTSDMKDFFWLLALWLYIGALSNLNPLQEGDGYQALSNYLKDSKLRINALNLLSTIQFKFLFNKIFLKTHRSELLYWGICLVFFSINVFIAILAQHYLQLILPSDFLGISTYYLCWLIPLLVVLNFMVKIFRSIPVRLQDAR